MLQTPLASERIQRIDPATGIKVIQLTSYPTPSMSLPYDWPSVTPDNGRVVIMCQRAASRSAPWDLFRCDTDGLNLFQLTERDQAAYPPVADKLNAPTAKLSLDGTTLYAVWNGDPTLYVVDVETGASEALCSLATHCPDGVMFQHMRLSPSSGRLFIALRRPQIRTLRVDLTTGDVEDMDLDGLLWACVVPDRRLIVARNATIPKEALPDYRSFVQAPGGFTHWSVDEDGADARFFCGNPFAHATMLGGTARIQGCGAPPDRCIWLAEEGQGAAQTCPRPLLLAFRRVVRRGVDCRRHQLARRRAATRACPVGALPHALPAARVSGALGVRPSPSGAESGRQACRLPVGSDRDGAGVHRPHHRRVP